MKKLFTLLCTLALGASLSFAQGTTGSPDTKTKTTTGKSDNKSKSHGKKGGKKGKKNSGGSTTPPPK